MLMNLLHNASYYYYYYLFYDEPINDLIHNFMLCDTQIVTKYWGFNNTDVGGCRYVMKSFCIYIYMVIPKEWYLVNHSKRTLLTIC